MYCIVNEESNPSCELKVEDFRQRSQKSYGPEAGMSSSTLSWKAVIKECEIDQRVSRVPISGTLYVLIRSLLFLVIMGNH